jgi:hypothetical protein
MTPTNFPSSAEMRTALYPPTEIEENAPVSELLFMSEVSSPK